MKKLLPRASLVVYLAFAWGCASDDMSTAAGAGTGGRATSGAGGSTGPSGTGGAGGATPNMPDATSPRPDVVVQPDTGTAADASLPDASEGSADDGGAVTRDASTGDRASPPDGPASDVRPPDGGARLSLESDLASKWVGERRSMGMDGSSITFTGVFNANEIGGPNGHTVRLAIAPGRDYVFEYRIRFDANFDFSRGGKIPGLAGATAPTGCVSASGDGFSARMMWRQNGALIGYIYDNTQSGDCGNAISTTFNFVPAIWYRMKERVKLNTGTAGNGILQIWVDDRILIDRSNMAYMNEAPNRKIDVVLFHSFFGGSTQDWAPSRTVSITFADPFVTKLAD